MAQIKRKSRLFRIILTILCLIVALVALLSYLINSMTRNAPLTIGTSADSSEDVVFEATQGTIPYGTPPRDLLLLSDQNGDWDLVLLKTDGTMINLSHDETHAQDLMGSWSFDSDTISFLSNRDKLDDLGPAQVRVSDPNIRTLTILAGVMMMFREQQFDWDPVWSPNGQAMVWVSVRDLNLEIYHLDLQQGMDIQNAVRLTNDGERDWYPSWSPDGTQILYNHVADGNEDIFLMDLSTKETRQLTDSPEDDIRGLWSLDGQQIVFASERDIDFITGGMNLYVMNVDGTEQRALSNDILFEGGAVWTPNASHMAYNSNREGSWQIYVQQADGTNLRRVTDGAANYLLPAWRP